MLSFEGINWIAVIVSGVIYFALGAAWYSPLLFAKQFMRFRGIEKPEDLQADGGNPLDYVITFIGCLIAALVLALLIKTTGTTTLVNGVMLGLVTVVGLTAPSTLTYTVFSGPHKGLWMIYAGYQVVAFAVMGGLLAIWV